MTEEKVFCRLCAHLSIGDKYCFEHLVKTIDNWHERLYIYEKARKVNKNNDCPDYKELSHF